MPEIEVEIEVWCERCGAGLCNQSTPTNRRGRPGINVEPCQRCIDDAVRQALDEEKDAREAAGTE